MSAQSEAVKRTHHTKLNLIRRYKAAIGCACGEKRLPALELHHREPELKDERLTRTNRKTGGDRWKALSYGELVEELGKCDVVCANCHRVQRFVDEGWAKITPDVRERTNVYRLKLEEIVMNAEKTSQTYGGTG